MKVAKVVDKVTIALAVVAIGAILCWLGIHSLRPSDDAQDVNLEPELVQGSPVVGAAMISYRTVDPECEVDPYIADVRPADHPSLGVLPKLGSDDYDVLRAFYHFNHRDEYGCQLAGPGEKYWDLYAIEFKCGPAILHPQVYDLDGTKIVDRGILMFLNWPGAEQFPVQIDPPYSQYGVAGFTENGNIGWAYGGESHIGPAGGPYMVWASSDPASWDDRTIGSDAFADVGWWDDHCTPNPMFRLTRKAGAQPPTADGYRLVDFDEQGNVIGIIPFQTEEPPSGERILSLYKDDEELGYVIWQTK